MKEGIHPKYQDVEARCACGATWKTRSTKNELHLEICSACHPFFTGRQKLIDTEGRVERFTKKYGAQTSEARKAAAKAKGLAIEIIRVGSRGMVWLEPLVEVECDGQRIAYGPVRLGSLDVGALREVSDSERAELGALLAASKRPALLARMHEPVALHGFLVRIGAVVSSESVALARPIRQAGDATIAT